MLTSKCSFLLKKQKQKFSCERGSSYISNYYLDTHTYNPSFHTYAHANSKRGGSVFKIFSAHRGTKSEIVSKSGFNIYFDTHSMII